MPRWDEVSDDRKREVIADTCVSVAFLFGRRLGWTWRRRRQPFPKSLLNIGPRRRYRQDIYTWLSFPDAELVDDILRFVENKLVRHNEMRAERNLEPYWPDKGWLIGAAAEGVAWAVTGTVGMMFDAPGDPQGDVYTELHYPTGYVISRIETLVKVREQNREEFRQARWF